MLFYFSPFNLVENPSSQAYEDFVKTLSRKRDFRYGFALYNAEIKNVSMRKTIAVAWQVNKRK